MKDAHCSTEKKACPGKALMKIAVGALTIWGIGMIWYGDLAFGKQWMALTGITPEIIAETMKTEAGKIMGLSILNCLAVSFALHALFCMANAFCFGRRLAVALFAAVGIAGTVMFSGVIWEGKPVELFVIGLGYYAVAFVSVAGMSSLLGKFCGKGGYGGHGGESESKDGCCAK
ncbi:MAG: DUF1761 domain-containing protein [Candidatus Omnitrophica bacterium]|nr:DUF1761 domain-containing protein [Candidatus Omnitrophota bacterium]